MPVTIHGREYLTVAERVNAIHSDHEGDISITTEIVEFTDERALVKATVSIHKPDKSDQIFTGHAFEKADASRINQTSYLEVCETSAIGRALASSGRGGSEFASADEVANAVAQQASASTGPSAPSTPAKESPAPPRKSNGVAASPKSTGFMMRLIKEIEDPNSHEFILAIQNKVDDGEDLLQSEVSDAIDRLKEVKEQEKNKSEGGDEDEDLVGLPF